MKLVLPRLLMLISKYSLRLFIIQAICMNFVLARTSNSQNLDEVKISINLTQASIIDVLHEIESKTDFVFAYAESIVKLDQAFTLNHVQSSLRQVLEDISRQGSLKFRQINNTISVVHFKRERVIVKIPAIQVLVTITGKVTDAAKEPLPGVNVVLKGTSTGTVTDVDGEYALSVPEARMDGTLVFSFIGYEAVEEPIAQRTRIDIELKSDVKTLNEVVVIGYQTVEKRDVTGAVSTINPESQALLCEIVVHQGKWQKLKFAVLRASPILIHYI
jgi:TonB-dependent starch-binding outer membrane protein SusC